MRLEEMKSVVVTDLENYFNVFKWRIFRGILHIRYHMFKTKTFHRYLLLFILRIVLYYRHTLNNIHMHYERDISQTDII